MAIPPTTTGQPYLGILGGDLAGFPNGRHVFDDVATIELRAIAGATIPLVDSSFTPDTVVQEAPEPFADPNGGLQFGLIGGGTDLSAMGTETYLSGFPYLGTPHSRYTPYGRRSDGLIRWSCPALRQARPPPHGRRGIDRPQPRIGGPRHRRRCRGRGDSDRRRSRRHRTRSQTPRDRVGRQPHVAVRSRPTLGEPVFAAVFGQLPEGVHEFRQRPADPLGPTHQIDVVGGELVELRWNHRARPARDT